MMLLRKRIAVGAIALCGGLVLTACGADPAPAEGGDTVFLDRAAIEAEYAETLAGYDLPPGRALPTEALPNGPTEGQIQAGYGVMAATSVWNCAWAAEYMDRVATPGADASAALDRFLAILDAPGFSTYFDPVSFDGLFADIAGAARLGDNAKMQNFLVIDCPGYLGATDEQAAG